ncbi:type II toxin-antitoxin system RelE/ParE family toxin [Pseudomonas gingeri]|uniref:type II toxin-antitoxin system RelE/ParE family toxin n=1 Tax=Pseudomonas gingeri TaxID=117681 RepID=UPI00210E3144|nr:type II toxin-antitoxin system RelE/ParE family toxin [Pseudomonas gingeri]
MPVLEWLQIARADLLAIVDYISDDNPDAAQWLKDDIEAKRQSCQSIRNIFAQGACLERGKWLCAPITW